jgi:hypothetical protein
MSYNYLFTRLCEVCNRNTPHNDFTNKTENRKCNKMGCDEYICMECNVCSLKHASELQIKKAIEIINTEPYYNNKNKVKRYELNKFNMELKIREKEEKEYYKWLEQCNQDEIDEMSKY